MQARMLFSVNAQAISQAIRLLRTKPLLVLTLSRRVVDVVQLVINVVLSHAMQEYIDCHYHHGSRGDY